MGTHVLSPKAVLRFAVAVGCLMFSAPIQADPYHASSTLGELEDGAPAANSGEPLARLTVSPLRLSGGSNLTVVSPQAWSRLSNSAETALAMTHKRLTNLFGELPPVSTTVRLMTPVAFTKLTGAPAWTNALYVRGQVLIPIDTDQLSDHSGLTRSVSHEYTHAVLSALSKGRAPGWLDEGLAQWIEGEENPILKPALRDWLSNNEPISLSLLQGGFTRLDPDMVPAAYAQSLLSATIVINTYGFSGIRRFLDLLATGTSQSAAVEAAWGTTLPDFEERLYRTLRKWHNNQMKAPITRAGISTTSTIDAW